MATKTSLTENQKIALGVGGVVVVSLIGLHLYNQSRLSQTVTNDGLTVKQTGAETIDITYTQPGGGLGIGRPGYGPVFYIITIFGPGVRQYGYEWNTTAPYSSAPAPAPTGTGTISSDYNTVNWKLNLTSIGGQSGTYTIKAEKGQWLFPSPGVEGMGVLGSVEVNITINTIGTLKWWQKI